VLWQLIQIGKTNMVKGKATLENGVGKSHLHSKDSMTSVWPWKV